MNTETDSFVLQADVAILEEPEHLTWFHHGRRYTEKFRHVIGIMHTNYVDYVRRGGAGNAGGPLAARIVAVANRRMCDIHCHKACHPANLPHAFPGLPAASCTTSTFLNLLQHFHISH